jgi:hypothetical protein
VGGGGGGASAISSKSKTAVAPAGNEPVRYAPPPLEPDGDELDHYKTQVKIMTDLLNEEMSYSSTLKAELKKLEELSQKSGDQTVEELRAVRQMFEQSEESRNAS